ncbi:hypothetical protein WJX74_002499 [Apatococcus lobatus]|uniref:S-adenosyl-L-methionine-dependent methyltransferase n=1 Tax=Apatococcus lobatus TaxID=904363 RepID=A0AAW1RA09_9CHLO
MLVFRTVNQDLKRPNANEDVIARCFRDKLMPIRAVTTKVLPKSVQRFQKFVEHPTRGTPGVCNFVDARTTWFDKGVKQAIADGIKQVVIIAAGYDTRSYRKDLHPPGVKYFEIDLPEASLRKQKLVRQVLHDYKEYPRPEYLAADLSKTALEDVLVKSSFDTAQPAILLCEGLLYYLDTASSSNLLKDASSMAALGSHIMFDFLHQNAWDGSEKLPGYAQTAKAVANKGEPFRSAMKQSLDCMRESLSIAGWELSILLTPRYAFGETPSW